MEKRKYAILAAVAFAVFVTLISVADRYLPCYYESTGTFFYDGTFLTTLLSRPLGIFELVMRFFAQFFINPVVGVAVLSLMLCGCAVMGVKVAERWTGRFIVAGAAPAVVVGILLFYRNKMFVALPMLATVEALLLLIPCGRKPKAQKAALSGRKAAIVQAALFIVAVGVAAPLCIKGQNEFLKKQSCMARDGKWEEIIDAMERSPYHRISVFQNYANLALARKGQLSKRYTGRRTAAVSVCFFLRTGLPKRGQCSVTFTFR